MTYLSVNGQKRKSAGLSYLLVVLLVLSYAAASFLYSAVAFASRQPILHFHEYSPSNLLQEVGGHLMFGMLTALPLLNPYSLILLAGGLALAIDSDHVLGVFNLTTTGRPSHSFLFIPISMIVLLAVGGRFNLSKETLIKIGFLSAASFLSHVAYDIFAAYVIFPGKGESASFPLLIPFNFRTIHFQYPIWMIFETLGILTAVLGFVVSKYAA